ncbi:MAG: hypothetical protein V1854_04940 [Methanobacteriota archaeon]
MNILGAVGEVGFLGGIALTAFGFSELINNKDKKVGSIEIYGGIATMFVSSYLKTASKSRSSA